MMELLGVDYMVVHRREKLHGDWSRFLRQSHSDRRTLVHEHPGDRRDRDFVQPSEVMTGHGKKHENLIHRLGLSGLDGPYFL